MNTNATLIDGIVTEAIMAVPTTMHPDVPTQSFSYLDYFSLAADVLLALRK